MKRPRKYRTPHQYSLRLDNPNREVPTPVRVLPHIVKDSRGYHLFKSRWKSQFRGPHLWAACITANSIRELKEKLAKDHDKYRFGYKPTHQ